MSDVDKRQRKQTLQEELRKEYQTLKSDWEGNISYDGWFSRSLNNAQLSTVSAYNDLVPVFDKLLENVDGDLAEFYASVIKISKLSEQARSSALEAVE